MTDYTPAKDRLLVALAEWWDKGLRVTNHKEVQP